MRRNVAFFFVIAIALLLLESHTRARVVFSDRFEYAVGRSDPNAVNLFVQNGWSHAKTQQNASGAKGYLYTVTSIPGYSGPFPGTNSSRVLAMEALPITLGFQTDFYLQLGNPSSSAYNNTIPGDVWFQFWMYPRSGQFGTHEKFLYACNTDYPCHSHKWMVMTSSTGNNPNNMFPFGHPTNGDFMWLLRRADGVSEIINTTGEPDSQGAISSPNPTEWMRPNRWTLVKMHFNTTRTSGNSWEVWLRPYRGGWTKVSEWIGGVTPGFTWNIPAEHVGGHRVLRMPTTVGYDYLLFMDDFVMATTESDLPVYSDSTGTPGPTPGPRPPADLRIIREALHSALLRSPATFLKPLGLLH
jgi:hypothetical protein